MEGLAGGPSANIRVMAQVGHDLNLSDKDLKWLCGCYAAIYNAPAATALFRLFPLEDVLDYEPETLSTILEEHWLGLPVHSNRRRTCGLPRKMAASMLELAAWAAKPIKDYTTYDEIWEDVNSIRSVGRYFGIKLAGIMHRVGLTYVEQYDVRARGAKNGRRSLAYLYPEHAEVVGDHHNNHRDALSLVDKLAYDTMERLRPRFPDLTWFELEALLCEYNQCVKGKRYPGKTSDADLSALLKVEKHFGYTDFVEAVYQARLRTHPSYALGEVHGWEGKREKLLKVYSDCGYMWSDAIYLYRGDFMDNPFVMNTELFELTKTKPTGGTQHG